MPNSERAQRKWVGIGQRLKRARLAVGYKRANKFAEVLGTDSANLANWELGRSRISIEAMDRLKSLFGVTSDWVFYGDPKGLPAELRDKLITYDPRTDEDA